MADEVPGLDEAAVADFLASLIALRSANSQNNAKGNRLKNWFQEHLKSEVAVSLVNENKQIGNRFKEQRGKLAPYSLFLFPDEATLNRAFNRVAEYSYGGLQSIYMMLVRGTKYELRYIVTNTNPDTLQLLLGSNFGADKATLSPMPPPKDGFGPSTNHEPEAQERPSPPTNLILFGPPGTGKTYVAAAEAVRLCGVVPPEDREALMLEYRRLSAAGRIEFVTFHQSYGYEEFVEGLRPRHHQPDTELNSGADAPTPGMTFELVPEPGVLRRLARRAAISKRASAGGRLNLAGRKVFKMSLGEAANPEDDYLFDEAIRDGVALLGWGDKVDWSPEKYKSRDEMLKSWQPFNPEGRPLSAKSGYIKYPHLFRNRVQLGDVIVVSKGNSLFRAVGIVAGGYEYRPREYDDKANVRRVDWLWHDHDGVPSSDIYGKSFAQGSLYELNTSDIKVAALERYLVTNPDPEGEQDHFVLVIDEINRANVSKVFGEAITLLETDKRIGMLNEIRVTLPYSGEEFGLPANLHIVGTMNTSDRSIALLDTALRRRFEFVEVMPDPAKLPLDLDGVPLRAVLARINERIEYLFDREHQIGHAFFMACETKSDVDAVMRTKVIPLLQEYFFEDWGKVARVLGDSAVDDAGQVGFLTCEAMLPPEGEANEHASKRLRWRVREAFAIEAYQAFQ